MLGPCMAEGFGLFGELARELERHVLARAFPTPSPLHERIRDLTATRYAQYFGGSLDAVIESARALRDEVHRLESSARAGGPKDLSNPQYPLVWSHKGFRPQHLLLARDPNGQA